MARRNTVYTDLRCPNCGTKIIPSSKEMEQPPFSEFWNPAVLRRAMEKYARVWERGCGVSEPFRFARRLLRLRRPPLSDTAHIEWAP
jgi:hypothetical protein